MDAARSALGLDTNNPHLAVNLCYVLSQAGALEEAEAMVRRAVTLAPQSAGFHSELARILAQSGRLTEALDVATTACRLEPGNAHLLIQRATLHGRARQPDMEIADLQQALAIQPDNTNVIDLLEQAKQRRRII